MIRHILCLGLLVAILSSCATTSGIVRPGFRASDVQAIPFLSPVAQIATIETGNQPHLSPEASTASVHLLRELLIRHQAELHLSGEMVIPDSLQAAAQQEIYRAVEGIDKRLRLDTGANLPTLDYLLSTQNQRYALVAATQGFTRTPDNYSGQLAKSIGVGVLTMGMLVPISIKAKSIVCLFIYDRQQKAIVYYNHTPPPAEREPLNQAVVEQQLRKMLAKDFPLR